MTKRILCVLIAAATVIVSCSKQAETNTHGQPDSPYTVDENGCASFKISDEGHIEVYFANGTNDKCVILYPGGSYTEHNIYCVSYVYNAFKGRGVTLIVDYYTLPQMGALRDQAIADANKAIDLARENKDIWGGYTKVGLIGNSAGGHLAGYIGQTRHKDVDFQILLFPVVTLESGKTHTWTRNNWLGMDPSEELVDLYSNEKHVSPDTPPTYLSYSIDDGTVPQVYNGKVLGEALRAINHPNFEEHVYNDNSHGVTKWPDWPEALFSWLDKLGN